MKRLRRGLGRACDGAATVEFVIVAPFLILLVSGVFQLCLLYLANAGLHQAVEAGARYATIFPRPSDTQITKMVRKSAFGMDPAGIAGPTITRGTRSGAPYIDITMTYSTPLTFVFLKTKPVKLTYSRRAYQV